MVVKDIEKSNVTVGGVPEKVISLNGSDCNITKATEMIKRSDF
ncbi:hypothetical protein [Acetivibrio cellulolyticus]|nr:hypothetical protein [Acetivibrio cellulolyticus]